MSTIIRIIVVMMKNSQIEILIEQYRCEEREKRNRALRAELTLCCDPAELFEELSRLSIRREEKRENFVDNILYSAYNERREVMV